MRYHCVSQTMLAYCSIVCTSEDVHWLPSRRVFAANPQYQHEKERGINRATVSAEMKLPSALTSSWLGEELASNYCHPINPSVFSLAQPIPNKRQQEQFTLIRYCSQGSAAKNVQKMHSKKSFFLEKAYQPLFWVQNESVRVTCKS